MDIQLLITNVGHTISIVLCLSLGILVLSRGPRKTLNRLFFLFILGSLAWEVSYLFGINIHDPHLSRLVFMLNATSVLTVILNTHLVLHITNRIEKQKKILYTFYAISFVMIAFFFTFPDSFLAPSQPKLYFPNFFVPGPYYFIGDIFFFAMVIYLFYNVISAYRLAEPILKNRLRYFIIALITGYVIGLTPEFLLYNIEVDPFIAFLFGIYTIPMAYSIIEYDLIDINIVAKKGFWYALGVTGIALLVSLINNANDLVISLIPSFPHWLIPIISAILAMSTGVFVWKKIRETDILKDEFINIVMHKFRTPLTYINWSIENLKKTSLSSDQQKELENVEGYGESLVNLTNTMVNLANIGNNDHMYNFDKENVTGIISSVIKSHLLKFKNKNINLQTDIANNLPLILMDKKRIEFAIETLIENSINYTPENGQISIELKRNSKSIIFSVKDNGMGISKEDIGRIFTKFFRGAGAKAYTEGMGIGLFITRDIVHKHGGEIQVESGGVGKGSSFRIILPVRS